MDRLPRAPGARRPTASRRRQANGEDIRPLSPLSQGCETQYTAMSALFPLDFRECCGCVAGIVVVEQGPSWAFGRRRGAGRDCYRRATSNKPAHIRGQRLEISALVREGCRPCAHWSVAGNHTLRGEG